MNTPAKTIACRSCGGPTREHCPPTNRCAWFLCLNSKCGGYGTKTEAWTRRTNEPAPPRPTT